jgi:hypothetical protein
LQVAQVAFVCFELISILQYFVNAEYFLVKEIIASNLVRNSTHGDRNLYALL